MSETEIHTCRECGTRFDLMNQPYYDNLCPDCIDDERLYPSCSGCGETVKPENATTVKRVWRTGMGKMSEMVTVHDREECIDEIQTHLGPP